MSGCSNSKLFRTTAQLRPGDLEELEAVIILTILGSRQKMKRKNK